MKMDTSFQFKRLRNAELIIPPNRLREKAGFGGLDNAIIAKAQKLIETNTVDFIPVGDVLLDLLEENIRKILNQALTGEYAIEALIYPVMQLKAEGAMFSYPLITDIASILISFLEIIPDTGRDAMEVIIAHQLALKAVLRAQITGEGGKQGDALRQELREACLRYFEAFTLKTSA